MTIDISSMGSDIRDQIRGGYEHIRDLYQELHRYPELSFQEHKTGMRVADELEALGYEVTRNVGHTGVVALLKNGDGPTVMLRADMDALPIAEQTGLDFASNEVAEKDAGESVPVMHACGHDLHSSCLVGTAMVMMKFRDRWRGTLMLVGQPAEEIFGGAQAMLDDGLYERFPRPDVVLGQHNFPGLAGTVGHNAGQTMAAATTLGVTIHGAGGHGSAPDRTTDPVVIAAHIVTRLQTIVSREVSPEEAAVVTIGKLQAGHQGNVIPDRAELEINVRSFDNALHHRVMDSIRLIVEAECTAGRCPSEPEFEVLSETITLDNNAAATEQIRAAHAEFLGVNNVFPMPRLSASEDFPYFGNAGAGGFDGDDIPYVYWFVGSVDQKHWDQLPGSDMAEKLTHTHFPHSPYYAPGCRDTFETGIATLTVAALSYLDDAA